MTRTRLSVFLRLALVLAAICGSSAAAPYGPEGRETEWQQPDGSMVKLRVFGDEFYARTETTDGYTVILNRADQTYYYASLAAGGYEFHSSGIRADRPAPAGLPKHLGISRVRVREINRANRAKRDATRAAKWESKLDAIRRVRASGAETHGGPTTKAVTRELAAAKALAAPFDGAKTGLTILIQFPGDGKTAPTDFPTSRGKIERFCNEVGYSENGNTGSVRDYFFDQSLGKLTYTQNVTKIITVPHPRAYYNYSDYPTNKVIYEDAGESGRMLLTDAIIELVKQGFDFSTLSLDEYHQAIATNVFFAGPDSGSWSRGLWPHQWYLGDGINVGTQANPLYINNYQITNIQNAAPVIGTFCHENGHLILNYPDLYSELGEGVGEHCLMGSGNYLNGGRTPAPINAYLKDIAGWENVTEIAVNEFLTATLPTTGNVSYKIRKPGSQREYYLIENRGTGDRWAQYTEDKGIAIWHVDETIPDGNIDGLPHYGVALKQADGRMDLENRTPAYGNRGDGQDLFDLGTPRFADNTRPNANWWSGKKSGVRVQVLSLAGEEMRVQFGAVPPDTIQLAKPNGGDVMYPGSEYPITWEANIVGNVRIDLFKGGELYKPISKSVPNTGHFKWSVPYGLVDGTDYSVVITSLTNKIPARDESDASFAVNTRTFPRGGVMPLGWFKPKGAARSWEVTKSITFEGKHALVSQQIGDGKVAAIAHRSTFAAGVVSFYLRVSSEQSYDVARFSIDGVPQILGLKDRISGRADWAFFSFQVPAGEHTLTWSYEKDTSYLGGSDAAWLDGVSLPATKSEIADQSAGSIKNVKSVNLTGLRTGPAGLDSSRPLGFAPGLRQSATISQAVEVIGGQKYLTLTVIKPDRVFIPERVEVSSNLLDWFSGARHTTVITDDATTLKVRDNTPLTRHEKRFIRLR